MADTSTAAPEIAGRRQLFIDDWLVAETHGIARVLHQPTKYVGNPGHLPYLPAGARHYHLRRHPVRPGGEPVPHVVPGARPDCLRRVVCHLAGRYLLGEAIAGHRGA